MHLRHYPVAWHSLTVFDVCNVIPGEVSALANPLVPEVLMAPSALDFVSCKIIVESWLASEVLLPLSARRRAA